jgi:uncharacterized protein
MTINDIACPVSRMGKENDNLKIMENSIELQNIKDVAWQLFPNCKVILFGSRARKDNRPDSDYDILLVIDKTIKPEEKIPLRTSIRKELLKFRILTDILIQSEEEIEEKSQLTGHIIRTAMKEGIVI